MLRDRRGVGMLFLGMVLLLFVYYLIGYSLYISQVLNARGALLKATLAAAKAGAYQVSLNAAETGGGGHFNRQKVENAVQETFNANLPPAFCPGNTVYGHAKIKKVQASSRVVEVTASCGMTVNTPFGPRDIPLETTCSVIPRSLKS